MKNEANGSLFSPDDVVSTYTDAEACDDGVLIALNATDRVMCTMVNYLTEKAPKSSQPPSCWPVEMMTWFRAASISKAEAQKLVAKHGQEAQRLFEQIVADRKALALCRGLISRDRQRAVRQYEQNTDGGIFKLYAIENNGQIAKLSESQEPNSTTLWFMPNENGGITLMFPEDY